MGNHILFLLTIRPKLQASRYLGWIKWWTLTKMLVFWHFHSRQMWADYKLLIDIFKLHFRLEVVQAIKKTKKEKKEGLKWSVYWDVQEKIKLRRPHCEKVFAKWHMWLSLLPIYLWFQETKYFCKIRSNTSVNNIL